MKSASTHWRTEMSSKLLSWLQIVGVTLFGLIILSASITVIAMFFRLTVAFVNGDLP